MSIGTIQHKESFLNKLAKNLGRERITHHVERPNWKYQPQHEIYKDYSQEELVGVLRNHCFKIHTHVEEAKDREELLEILEKILNQMNAKSIVSWDDPRFQESGIQAYFDRKKNNGMDVHIWDPQLGDENIQIAERADFGITFSDITLAESGTVVLFSNNGKGRSVSLLPTNYIAIIPKSTIVPRLTQATQLIHQMQQKRGKVPSCINFISGPSNSADIEMNLVVGVHGPIQAYYIIVQ